MLIILILMEVIKQKADEITAETSKIWCQSVNWNELEEKTHNLKIELVSTQEQLMELKDIKEYLDIDSTSYTKFKNDWYADDSNCTELLDDTISLYGKPDYIGVMDYSFQNVLKDDLEDLEDTTICGQYQLIYEESDHVLVVDIAELLAEELPYSCNCGFSFYTVDDWEIENDLYGNDEIDGWKMITVDEFSTSMR